MPSLTNSMLHLSLTFTVQSHNEVQSIQLAMQLADGQGPFGNLPKGRKLW